MGQCSNQTSLSGSHEGSTESGKFFVWSLGGQWLLELGVLFYQSIRPERPILLWVMMSSKDALSSMVRIIPVFHNVPCSKVTKDISYYGGKRVLVAIKILPVNWTYGDSGVLLSVHPVDGEARSELSLREPETDGLCEDDNICSRVHEPFNMLSIQAYGHHRGVGENRKGSEHLVGGIIPSYWQSWGIPWGSLKEQCCLKAANGSP